MTPGGGGEGDAEGVGGLAILQGLGIRLLAPGSAGSEMTRCLEEIGQLGA